MSGPEVGPAGHQPCPFLSCHFLRQGPALVTTSRRPGHRGLPGTPPPAVPGSGGAPMCSGWRSHPGWPRETPTPLRAPGARPQGSAAAAHTGRLGTGSAAALPRLPLPLPLPGRGGKAASCWRPVLHEGRAVDAQVPRPPHLPPSLSSEASPGWARAPHLQGTAGRGGRGRLGAPGAA